MQQVLQKKKDTLRASLGVTQTRVNPIYSGRTLETLDLQQTMLIVSITLISKSKTLGIPAGH
jgi:hypothetical protein